jgi:hypothetical protein
MANRPQEQQRPFPEFHGPDDEPLNEEKYEVRKMSLKKYVFPHQIATLWTDELLEDIADNLCNIILLEDDLVKIRAIYMLPVRVEGRETFDYVHISLVTIEKRTE